MLREPLNKSAAAHNGSFAPTDRFGTKSLADRSCNLIRASLYVQLASKWWHVWEYGVGITYNPNSNDSVIYNASINGWGIHIMESWKCSYRNWCKLG